jgi:hypothetical protein
MDFPVRRSTRKTADLLSHFTQCFAKTLAQTTHWALAQCATAAKITRPEVLGHVTAFTSSGPKARPFT